MKGCLHWFIFNNKLASLQQLAYKILHRENYSDFLLIFATTYTENISNG